MAAVIAHGRAALKERAGNCQEYTAVVCHYLDAVQPRPVFDAVYFEPPGDHTFTVIGQQAGKDGAFPMQFAQWNADAAICDAWANIFCWARDYPNEWRFKMRKWERDGKKVSMAGTQYIDGVAVAQPDIASPLKDSWYEAPERYRKLSFTHRKKERCYITTAVCGSLGLPDDCEALSRMRAFRDEVLLHSPQGRRDVAAYYATAPAIVAAIDRSADPSAAYRALHERWLEPAVGALREGRDAAAHGLYGSMVAAARSRYGV
jgi:hypothetical protein